MNWMKFRFFYFALSLSIIIPGVYSLIRFGLLPSVEFTGGSVLELDITNPNSDQINNLLTDHAIYQLSLSQNRVTIKLEPINQKQVEEIKTKLREKFEKVEVVSFTSIGPSIGRQLLTKALTAIAIAATLTLLYTAYTFKNLTYGLSAIIAMLHDTLILLGSYSILGHFFGIQADLLFVTAVLTTLSFSVHDTIVVFDRIRELKNKKHLSSFEALANQAVTETMARSINNSLTIIFMLLALVLLGGETIHNFALALLIGAITGTYSSTFNAIPLLVTWNKLIQKK
mgnify:CR=1 FL=1